MDTAISRIPAHVVDRFYIGYLEDALRVIERALQAIEAGSPSDPSVFRAEVIAHKIKGNAALYDLPELGKIAERLEKLLKSDREDDRLITHMGEFADAMSDIIDIGRIREHEPGDPVSLGEASTEAPPASAGVPDNKAESDFAGRRILIVFENPWFEASLGEFIGGTSVKACRTCGEAIRWLAKNTPDLIVCESDLPDTPGVEFMQFMRASERFAKVPFLLAFPNSASFDEISEAIASGASAFTQNSGDVQRLADQIRELLSAEDPLVLIIDDDEPVRDVLKHKFEASGFAVDTAGDGIDALLKIRDRTPDLIILDRIMPRMDGEATLRELQATLAIRSIPVIMLTAMDNSGEASRWLMRGASEFISKPFDPEEVLERARKLLKRGKANFA